MGHFVALAPLTFPNLNISTIWVTDPWVLIEINFWVSLAPTKEVPHTCKIVNYFKFLIYFWHGGDKIVGGRGCGKRQGGGSKKGWAKEVGQGGGERGQGGGIYILMKYSTKQLEH